MRLIQLDKNMAVLMATALVILFGASNAGAQTSNFTYQGRLTDGGTAANGNYDLQFALWDSASGGAQIGSTLTLNTVPVSNGVFNVSLDFGASSFNGASRFLEVSARPISGGAFALLSPRQQVTSTPYAVRSASAATADTAANAITAANATQLGGVAASQYVQTSDSRLSDTRPPTAGSANYIQNSTNLQSSTNFNVSGDGTVAGMLSGNVVSAGTQFNLSGARILSISGSQFAPNSNLFVGTGAGQANTSSAGANTFVGQNAGQDNTTGGGNTFFGAGAGSGNTSGGGNTFVGQLAGSNQNGSVVGSFNTFIGSAARLGDFGLLQPTITNATAIGSGAHVDQSNSIVLGSILGSEGTADTNVGIGTRTPSNRLDIDVSHAVNDPGITIQGVISTVPDLGLRIKNRNAGNEWYIDSTGTGSAYGAGNLAVTLRGVTPAALIIHPSGSIELSHLGSAGATALCLNSQNVIGTCSSSLRYKTSVAPFLGGLAIINRLRPISFAWKQNHVKDIGLGAEEVEKVEPLLTFRNDKGEIEGVKYNQLSAVFINAFKEQQAQISHQQEQIERQQEQLREQQSSATLQQAEIKRLNSRLQAIERALRRRSSSRK
jgi:Chaperone of endosialidase